MRWENCGSGAARVLAAVNDKLAKNMLGEAMRRQLLMDGHFGHLMYARYLASCLCSAGLLYSRALLFYVSPTYRTLMRCNAV
jgi:hypothetical protein